MLTHPALCNQVTLDCILHSMTSFKDLKTKTKDKLTFLECLSKHQIYIEANSLVFDVIRIAGYLLKLHPNITHHVS